jgi:hypothetical protein
MIPGIQGIHPVIGAAATLPPSGGNTAFAGGALAWLSVNDGLGYYPFDQEPYDTGAFHSVVSSLSRLTVPSGVSLVRLIGQEYGSGSSTPQPAIHKNGATFLGGAVALTQDDVVSIKTGPVAVSASDYFELQKGTLASTSLTGGVWMAIEVLDSATKYAVVSKTGGQALTGGVTTALTWDNEVADTDGWHDTVTDNSRLTVPSGVTRIKAVANLISTGNVNTPYFVQITKNGAAVEGTPVFGSIFTGKMNLATPILEVSPGDYFEVSCLTNSGQTVANDNQTWFAIYEVPDYGRALVKKVATQGVTGGVTAALAFGSGSEVYDTEGAHDESTNNSRLTVPSGFTKAKLSFSLVTASAGGTPLAYVAKNGAAFPTPGLPGLNVNMTGVDYLSGEGAWIDVTAGDYFELMFTPGADQTLPADDRTWFAMELAS